MGTTIAIGALHVNDEELEALEQAAVDVNSASAVRSFIGRRRAEHVDHLAEARREVELGDRAAREVEEMIEAARTLFGNSMADALTRVTDRAIGSLLSASMRYGQVVDDRDARIAELEAELATVTHRCSVLSRDLTEEANRRQQETATALAALACLQGAIRWVQRGARGRRPGWLIAAGELIGKLEGA